MSNPGGKNTMSVAFFFFFFHFFSPNKQKTEHQSESNSAISWNPSLWKASLHHAVLKKVVPFFSASQLQSCLRETAEQTGEHHAACATPYLQPPWKIIGTD
jgi:hypothetical protein